MRKFTFLFAAIACVALQMQAVVVENVAELQIKKQQAQTLWT